MVQALQQIGVPRPLTPDEQFLLTVEDDTEEAPWMSMSDPQWRAATSLYSSLYVYKLAQHPDWYVGGMLPLYFYRPDDARLHFVAPDVFVAFVPDYPRISYHIAREGVCPAVVVEVISESSEEYDTTSKRNLYEWLGAQEYVLFWPEAPDDKGRMRPPRLEGYRRNAAGRFEPWGADAVGRRWSDVLGLYLLLQEKELRAQRPDGTLLLTHEESEDQRRREAELRRRAEETSRQEAELRRRAEETSRQAEEASRHEAELRRQAEEASRQEAALRQQAEEEAARLRAEIERLND